MSLSKRARRGISIFSQIQWKKPWYHLSPSKRMMIDLKPSNPFVDAGIQAMEILTKNGEAANVQELPNKEVNAVEEHAEIPARDNLSIQPDGEKAGTESGEEGTK